MVGLVVWLALPVFLIIQPASYFDAGAIICPSKRFFNIECPGCGLTRAVQHAIHFDWKTAWQFNKLFVIVVPVLLLVYIHVLGRILGKSYFGFLRQYY